MLDEWRGSLISRGVHVGTDQHSPAAEAIIEVVYRGGHVSLEAGPQKKGGDAVAVETKEDSVHSVGNTHQNNSNIQSHQQSHDKTDPIKQQTEPIYVNRTAKYEQKNGYGDPEPDPSDKSSDEGGQEEKERVHISNDTGRETQTVDNHDNHRGLGTEVRYLVK